MSSRALQKGRRPQEKMAKFQRAFAANWENCQQKYRAWQSNNLFRFKVKQMREMSQIAQEDFATALTFHSQEGSKTRAANEARMPYYLFVHMLDTAEMVALAALSRRESRGAHQREDFPDQDPR